jgi:hypothetical protein
MGTEAGADETGAAGSGGGGALTGEAVLVLVDAAGVGLGFETMRTKKSFSLILHDSIVLSSDKTLPE